MRFQSSVVLVGDAPGMRVGDAHRSARSGIRRAHGAATLKVLAALTACGALAGCGQKGPLTLPAAPGAASAPAAGQTPAPGTMR